MSAITSNLNINKHKNKNIMNTKKTSTKKATSTNKQFSITTYSTKSTEVKNVKLLFAKGKPKKETRKNTFNADSTSGYRYYDRNHEGVLHGSTGTMTGNMDDAEFYRQLYLSLMREEFVKYHGRKSSRYERMYGMAVYLYLQKEKHLEMTYHQTIGRRPGSNTDMEVDYVIRDKRTGWKMMIDINGGQTRGISGINVFHGNGRPTDIYKKKHYKKHGFDAMVAVNVYDNGTNPDTEMIRVFNKYDGSQHVKTRLLSLQALKNGVLDILKPLEKAGIITFDNKRFVNACEAAYNTVKEYVFTKKQCEMIITK